MGRMKRRCVGNARMNAYMFACMCSVSMYMHAHAHARTHTRRHTHTNTHTHTHTQGALSVTAVTAATAAGYSALFLAHEEDLNWQTRKSVRACLVCTCTVVMREREKLTSFSPQELFKQHLTARRRLQASVHDTWPISIPKSVSISHCLYRSIHPSMHPSVDVSIYKHAHIHTLTQTHTHSSPRARCGSDKTPHQTPRRTVSPKRRSQRPRRVF